ncbi:FGGY-family carbohydrate kinase [Chelativorans salis]|uniref:FGGY-family carbohydrate kinase n=1 Tax=Chelativorans salis TaxID=2978478 RepID=A0ABT2LR57_9HYPH|nr:FGGY-family carbohydrate kinase [Chelativorans sp. EGI FJ00035]MCT7377031.1 FGGY-family carbohydrate kinase [Chelativorans sp. EGI FJ00035]
MTGPIRHVAVIDIGKTNAKLALVDLERGAETDQHRMPNAVLTDGPYPHFDIEALWAFILQSLASLRRKSAIDAVSITTHGATAALIDDGDTLALPVLDYEYEGPQQTAIEYDTIRPPFTETGSPRLPIGLNLGAQLFWQRQAFPDAFARTRSILPYPQYWAWRLTGVAASEVTSLGCHTDLWSPSAGDFSSLVEDMGWRPLMPPMQPASARLGPVLPAVAEATGLDPSTPVLCGVHDSNASLLPHLISRRPPFSVVSTGTWVVAMAIGGREPALDPRRDTLVNVNAFGDPVPSARFMGGREFSLLTEDRETWTEADAEAVLRKGLFLLPSVQQGSGPFPDRKAEWRGEAAGAGEKQAATCFYLALMTATCLELVGAAGETIVEGPFAGNTLFIRMLAAATGRPVIADLAAATGTSIGAALLAAEAREPQMQKSRPITSPGGAWEAYTRTWKAEVLRTAAQ